MLDFAGKRWYYLWFSMIFFTAAAIALAIPPHLKPGIEFTSGSSFTEKFDNPSTRAHCATSSASSASRM